MQSVLSPCTQERSSWKKSLSSDCARALALFLGSFTLLNLFGGIRARGFDANLWWIDLRILPDISASLFLLFASLCLLAFAIRPSGPAWRRFLTAGVCGVLALAALWNTVEFCYLLAMGRVHPL